MITRPRFFVFLVALALCSTSAGCGARVPATVPFVETGETGKAGEVGAMAALKDGGLIYGERQTGTIWQVDRTGMRNPQPLADLDVASDGERGLLGLTQDDKGRTFASWTAPDGQLLVADISTAPGRVVWDGPIVPNTHIGGRLAFTPTGRIVIGLGDLRDRTQLADDKTFNGKLITLDPDRESTQQPNVISRGWTDPRGLAYVNGALWVADMGFTSDDRVGRAGDNGFNGKSTPLGRDTIPIGLTAYGDNELAVCMQGNHRLQRFYVESGTEAIKGRLLATDCNNGVIELIGAKLAYASTNAIRTSG